jgi:hypothetical protein
VDHFLAVVINSLEDIPVIPKNSFSSIETFVVGIFSSSHLVPEEGDNISDQPSNFKFQSPIN